MDHGLTGIAALAQVEPQDPHVTIPISSQAMLNAVYEKLAEDAEGSTELSMQVGTGAAPSVERTAPSGAAFTGQACRAWFDCR